jgi:hypothetical protein
VPELLNIVDSSCFERGEEPNIRLFNYVLPLLCYFN